MTNPVPNLMQTLFQPNNISGIISKGSLINFNYGFHKPGHDPRPLVIVTDVWPNMIRGLNLHYLTFPYIKNLLQKNCNNKSFSYMTIKGDTFLKSSFRQYKKAGVMNVRQLDCAFLLNVLGSVRSLSPTEIEGIRTMVREQMAQQMNPKANDLTNANPNGQPITM
jgi:hypothetical protein